MHIVARRQLADARAGAGGGDRGGRRARRLRDPDEVDAALVDHAVAVIILTVAGLHAARALPRIGVVAVAAVVGPLRPRRFTGPHEARRITLPIAVEILVPVDGVRRAYEVDLTVAVVVCAVAHVLRRRVDGEIEIVAVAGQGGVGPRLAAGQQRHVILAEAVTIGVEVPGAAIDRFVVDAVVAVVVAAVAELVGAGEDRVCPIVAVAGRAIAVGCDAGPEQAVLTPEPVAVAVDRPRQLGG